jgi:Major Facilitator Superfamily
MIRTDDHDLSDGLPPPQRWRAMLAVAIAVSMSVLVTSIANIALPTIAHDMQATPAESIWVVNAYQLAVTVTLLPFASIGDIYGHRKVYFWAWPFTPPRPCCAPCRRPCRCWCSPACCKASAARAS